ncbi:prolyl oligopeptidase family serine peptidase [Sphingomonas japonica]|uniref:prolyl oligopeptidase n=1 Tax=Sphingomonas japonica TaxID=511662 RepID=A0ABX0U6C9_9SPHN|nr:prolyl oligopeptidase family serine peptidase [Sphingomonas japonica]NIJ25236.1 prolyl oligopeptidase [Sphingomonas japonica]
MNTPTLSLTRRRFLTSAALAGGAALLPRAAGAAALRRPPVARIEPVTETLWGEQITDPYRWLENDKDRDRAPFMRGQDAYARQVLGGYPDRPRLLERIAAMSGDVTQVVYPKPAGSIRFLQKRTAGASSYRIVAHYPDGHEQVLADPATFAATGSTAAITWWVPSPSGRFVAFGVALAGSENAVGHVVEVAGARLLAERIVDAQYAAAAWLPDDSGFFYNRFAGRPAGSADFYNDRSLWLHHVGTAQAADRRIMAAGMDAGVPMAAISSPEMQVGIGSDHVALLVRDGYVRSFAIYLARRDAVLAGTATWRRICGADEGVADFALSGDTLYVISNKQAANGALLAIDAATGTLASACTLTPAGTTVLDELNAGRDGTFVTVNDGGEQSLFFQPGSGPMRPVALPYSGWVQSVAVNPADGAALIRITSWLQPGTIFAIDARTTTTTNTGLQQRPAIDLSPYEYHRIVATVRDGTRVPISIVRRKGPIAAAPCLVHAYGAYQWPSQPVFDARGIAFLEAGGIIATAHVRGGGEYGRAWHEGGKQATKPNTWRDLIDCCETLIAQGHTSKRQLAIVGGSAGGIAVGRAMTERPDLFAAVISKVGMSNPLRAEFEPNGQPNVPEFGSIKDAAGFRALKAMDSYHAVNDGVRYPAVLLTTSSNDARVAPHNAAKMAARLQAADPRGTALLRIDFDGGHDMNDLSKAKSDAEYADDFAFILATTKGR